MGWDLHVFKFETNVKSVESLPQDYHPPVMGSSDDIRSLLSQAFPGTDWSDLSWGVYDHEQYALEFSIRKEGLIDSFAIHVHGNGDPATPIIAMCKQNSWSLFDTSVGDLIDLENPSSAGWESFVAYRNRVLDKD